MKLSIVDSPEITDASSKKATGKTLKQWFSLLDDAAATGKKRRDLTTLVYEQTDKDAWWSTTLVVEHEKARGQKEKDGRPTGYGICVTKTVAGSVGEVYRAFSDPSALSAWLGPNTKADVVDGGQFQNKDGDQGTFKRVRPDKDLRFTWDRKDVAEGSLVDVAFADKGKGKTGITLNHTRIISRADADRLRAGWGEAFDRLKELLESRSS
jgi:uncharacterized protein YndB with AHSA1/START domain